MRSRAATHAALNAFLIALVGMGTGVLAARTLGVVDRGYLGLVVFWPSFLIGITRPPYADAMVVASRKDGHVEMLPELAAAAMKTAGVLIIVLAPFLICGVWIALRAQPQHVVYLGVAFSAMYLVTAHINEVFIGMAQVKERYTIQNVVRLSVPVAYLVLSLLAVLLGAGLTGFVIAHILAMASSLLMRFVLLPPAAKYGRTVTTFNKELISSLVAFHAMGLVAMLAGQIDRLVLLSTSSPENIGLYLVALTVATPVQGLLGSAIASVALPGLAAARGHADRGKAAIRLLRLTATASLGGGVVVAIAAPLLTPIMFGKEYLTAGYVASGLSMASSPLPLRQAFAAVHKVQGLTNNVFIAEILYSFLFMSGYLFMLWLQVQWPVIIAFAIGNVGSTFFYARRFGRVWPESSSLEWLPFSFQGTRELALIAVNILTRR